MDEYPEVKKIFELVDDICQKPISKLCFEGPLDELTLTVNLQPAITAVNLAYLTALHESGINATISGGHSLGEYSALVAAGALTFETALKLVQKRGELMGEHGEGEMTAFMMDVDTIKPPAEQFNCAISACNQPQQTVVGGASADLEALEAHIAEAFPRKRAFRLKTEGAFHTRYMDTAADLFREALAEADMNAPEIKVLSNYTGDFHDNDVDGIKDRLYNQLKHPVMWNDNLVNAFAAGVDKIYEFGGGIGPGGPEEKRPNLEGMIKKASRAAGSEAVYVPAINEATIEAAVA